MTRTSRGFTLVEMIVVIVIIGILSAIAIPNYIRMQTRAKVGSLKANMHSFQMVCEDFAVQSFGAYPTMADSAADHLSGDFKNPFDSSSGKDKAWEDRPGGPSAPASAISGITSYGDSASGVSYTIKGYGKSAELALVLYAGSQAGDREEPGTKSYGAGGRRREPSERPEGKKTTE